MILLKICFLLCVPVLPLVNGAFEGTNSLVYYIQTFEAPSVSLSTKLLNRDLLVNNEIKASIPIECDLATLQIKKINHRIDTQLQPRPPSRTTTMCLLYVSCEESRWV